MMVLRMRLWCPATELPSGTWQGATAEREVHVKPVANFCYRADCLETTLDMGLDFPWRSMEEAYVRNHEEAETGDASHRVAGQAEEGEFLWLLRAVRVVPRLGCLSDFRLVG